MATAAVAKKQASPLAVSGDLLSAVGAVVIVGMMIVPLPGWLLDLLLGLNITLALTILLITIYCEDPLDFSSFPSVLLIVTLFRLALNISATRLILLHAEAGAIISAFGSVVVGGNYVVGLVVFIILVIIQFVVITNGAGRVAEVAARFTLDAMPGKQMAIDADLNAGLINEDEARERRLLIARESDFYGAMDGASKFVRGDAIAAVVMIIINILGGFTVGILQHKMDLAQSLQTYTLLTIGEGLVTQMPALLISTATGLVVTRAASKTSLGRNMAGQLIGQPRAIATAACILLVLALIPGIPKVPFIATGVLTGMFAMVITRPAPTVPDEPKQAEAPKAPENLATLVGVDPLVVEIGYGLIGLADRKQGGDLLDRVTALRRQLAQDTGLVTPPIRVRDNLQLRPPQYTIKLKGVALASGEIYPGQVLAMNPGGGNVELAGLRTTDPAFGLPATWIAEQDRSSAEALGYSLIDCTTVLITHLSEIIRQHASEIVTRQDIQGIIDNVREKSPAVIEELVPALLSTGDVQRVLGRLLDERVDIRDVGTILETLADWARLTKDAEVLTERVRERLGRQLTAQHTGADGRMHVFTLDPALEHHLSDSLKATEQGVRCIIDPALLQQILGRCRDQMEALAMQGYPPVVLVSPVVRPHLRRLIERNLPQLSVLSYNEISTGVSVDSIGMVSITDEHKEV